MKHVQIDAFISYLKTRLKNEYTARLSVHTCVIDNDDMIKNHTVIYLKNNDVLELQKLVLIKWNEISKSFKMQSQLNFCNDRMSTYNYRNHKLINNITSYNLILKS